MADTLCLKNKEVLTLTFPTKDAPSWGLVEVLDPELLPVAMKKDPSSKTLNKWMTSRRMPAEREGLNEVINVFKDSWGTSKNYLSLSDQYWIRRRGEKWEKVNYFTNKYSVDIGNMFFKPWLIQGFHINSNSPDLTTNGVLKKRWLQNNNLSSSLVKAGSKAARQEPLSEVLVSVLTERLGKIESAKYDLHIEGTEMCSICPNFVTQDTELVPAAAFYYDEPRDKANESVYDHLIKMCDKQEIPDAENFIKWLLVIDKLTGNGDRNLSNIGFIRNVKDMKFIGPAPLYDCGNAYWSTSEIGSPVGTGCFGGSGSSIASKMLKQMDMEVLQDKDGSFEKIIEQYPEITDEKKSELISAINLRNYELAKSQTRSGGELAR